MFTSHSLRFGNHCVVNFKQLAILALTCLIPFSAAQANVVFSDNFDGNNFASTWGVSDGNVDVGAYSDLCNNGTAGYCVDTEGTGPNANATFSLLSPITSLVAGDYTFSFDYANNSGLYPSADNVLEWIISSDQGLLSNNSVNSGSTANHNYTNASWSFSVLNPVSNAQISFSQTGGEGNWGGTVLDNVSLELTNAYAVPGPSSIGLLGLGLLGLAIRRRRQLANS